MAFLVFAFMGAIAQTTTPVTPAPAPNPQADNPNAPEIKFAKLVHDYGTIQKEADGNCEFEFQNTGKEPLVLSDVRSSCVVLFHNGPASQSFQTKKVLSKFIMIPNVLDR